MKKNGDVNRNSFKLISVAVVSISLFLVLFLFDFSGRVTYQINDMMENHLMDIGNESVNAVESEMNRMYAEVCYIGEYISNASDLTDSEQLLLMNQLKEKCYSSEVRLISGDGRFYDIEHNSFSDSSENYIKDILHGKSGITDVFHSDAIGDDVFAFYAPIKKNDIVTGGISVTMIVNQMVDLVNSGSFESSSYSYILKRDGTVVVQTSHPDSLYSGRDFFAFLNQNTEKSSITAEELQHCMELEKSGILSYGVGTEQRTAYYAPTRVNDWYVITVVTSKFAEAYTSSINLTAFYLTLKVVAVFMIIAIIIIKGFGETKKIILNSKTELELEKKKLELSLKHTTHITFEYSVKNDNLIFMNSPEEATGSCLQISYKAGRPVTMASLVDTEYLKRFQQILKQVSQGEEPEPEEILGGKIFKEDSWFRVTVSPLLDGKDHVVAAIGTLEDITEEKRIKTRFAQEEQYREALLSETAAMFSIDLINQQLIACSILGRNRMEGQNTIVYNNQFVQRISRLIHPDDRDRIVTFIKPNNMLAAYYINQRDLKELFRFWYPGIRAYKWITCTVSLLSEPTTGNPIAFAYIRDVDEETKRELELAYSSERDPLTGLYNRRNIADQVNRVLQDKDCLACLMMMDLDGFKGINDQFGHHEGDRILKTMAGILEKAFRAGDYLSRLGGDEFVVFLDHLPNKECAYERAEEVRRQVEELSLDNMSYGVSISIGIVYAPEEGDTFEVLYRRADEALYTAKKKGKNQIAFYGTDMSKQSSMR